MPLTPKERYQSDLSAGVILPDEAQAQAVDALQDVFERLNLRLSEKKSFLAKLLGKGAPAPITGLYMWGGVGRGKTYLMDSFYEALDFTRKSRMHFNRFMQRVHADLTELSGEKNPLDIVADRIASETVVLCFDEFYVSDIGDAMLLGGLMQKLFDRGICLVATSNIAPEGLYENGLQRARFIPAIKAVEANTRVLNVDSGIDYRLRVLSQSELYFEKGQGDCEKGQGDCEKGQGDFKEGEKALSGDRSSPLNKLFSDLSGGRQPEAEVLVINRRNLQALGVSEGVLLAEFAELCLAPRSAADYTQLAKEYHSVLIDNVPELTSDIEDGARRFITLIDEFYDRNIKVAIVANRPMASLYSGKKLSFEFQRTLSRLIEMQSVEYLGREHLP